MNDQKVKITVEAKDKTAGELAKARGEFDKTAASVKKANKILAAQELLGVKPYKDIQREIKQLQAAYNRLKRDGKTSAADLYQAQVKLKQKTAELKKETGDWAGQLGKAKAGIAGLAGIGYLFVKSFQKYSEFSQRMGEVNTLIDVSQERFAALGKEIRGLTKDIPQTASELAAAEYDIISAGVALEKSVGVLEKSAKAAVAGVTDTKTAANAGIAVINAYGKSIDELDDVYDILFKTVKLGVTTFPQLAASIGEVLPTAKAANVDIKDISASIAALTKAGIRTPQAMTALKGTINALAAPAPEAKKQFDALGITWEGLIPTLDKIRQKGLSIDQMRLLIPDVEARTGVLALTQNFDTLVEILGEMQDASGAMEEAYDKMKDTPENQMKLFGNVIDDLTLSAGALVSKGLLPVAKAVRAVIESLRDADPVTRGIVLTLASGAAGFAIWKLGLGSMVLGLKGLVVHAKTAQIAAGGLIKQFTTAGLAMKASFAASVIYTGYQLVALAKSIYEWRKAVAVAEEAENRLIENSDRVMKKFEEFKDVKLPDDITKMAQRDLEEFRKSLSKARAYYTALKGKLEERAEKKTILGNATDDAKEAQKELKTVNARLREISEDFKRVGDTAAAAGFEMGKPAKAIQATTEELDEFEKQAKAAYEEAKKQAADYAEQVIAWEEKIKYARLSTQDKIRELERKGADEAAAWADKKLEAEEKLYAAKQAMAKGDYELAEKLAKDAEGLYADLATEIKKTEGGNEVIVKSLEDTKQVAINGVQAVGQFIEDLYTKQKQAAEKSRDEWQRTAEVINQKLDEIAKEREANIQITLQGLEKAKDEIKRLVEPQTKHITIITHHKDAKQVGGPVLARAGRKLPGYGGGDKISALLEAGEFVIRKEAVKKYGAGLFHALNAMKVEARDALKARIGGLLSDVSIQMPRYAYQTGGAVSGSGPAELGVIRFQAGNVEMPLTTIGDTRVTRAMVKEFEKELIKMGLTRK